MNKIENITSDDALLLAYVAGELNGGELRQLEVRMASDSSLRPRAAALRGDYQLIMQAMASLDQLYQLDEQKSLRQINALFQNWEQDQAKVLAPASIPLYRWRPPVWSYAAAAMVALLIGFCFWWANNSPVSPLPDTLAQAPTSEPTPQVAVDAPTNPAPDTTQTPIPLAFQDVSSENSDRIDSLEKDVVAISSDNLSASNNLGDTNQ
jgi:anti-sigma-K factor RskA